MILQLLNREESCGIYYHKGEIQKINIKEIESYSHSWRHHPILDDEHFIYLSVLARQKPLVEYADSREMFLNLQNKIQAQKKAATSAKVSLEEFCFYDLIPEHVLKKWLEIKKSCLAKVATTESKREDYDILHKAHVLVENIAEQKVTYNSKTGKVIYNIFGSATL